MRSLLLCRSKRHFEVWMSAAGGRPLHFSSKVCEIGLHVFFRFFALPMSYSCRSTLPLVAFCQHKYLAEWRAELPQLRSSLELTKSTRTSRHVVLCRPNFENHTIPAHVFLKAGFHHPFIVSKESPVAFDGARGQKSVLDRYMKF